VLEMQILLFYQRGGFTLLFKNHLTSNSTSHGTPVFQDFSLGGNVQVNALLNRFSIDSSVSFCLYI
jgi:hypothetical protein